MTGFYMKLYIGLKWVKQGTKKTETFRIKVLGRPATIKGRE